MPGTDMVLRNQEYARQLAAKAAPAQVTPGATQGSGSDSSFGFDDLLDIVNPLQHIPVISTIYRHLTGDKIGTVAKLAGDTLYGGLTGLACSLGDTIFQEATGKGFGDTVYAMVIGDDTPATKDVPATGVASTTSPDTMTVATAQPDAPVAVKPASAEPTFSGLIQNISDTVDDITQQSAQQAVQAYRSAGRLLAAY